MKCKSSLTSFQAFMLFLIICSSGILPVLTSQGSQTISLYGTVMYPRARQEPPDGYCYHSAFIYTTTGLRNDVEVAINAFSNMVGKGLFYNDASSICINEGFWFTEGLSDWKQLMDKGLIQAISCHFWPTLRNVQDDDWTVQEIANGQHDNYLKALAGRCKYMQHPIFIRVGAEMNIHQGKGTWAGAYSFAKNPAAFVACWRKIVDLFRAEGASNVVFVWNPNWQDIGPHHWTEYYPGDDYVDWVGVDLYQFLPNSDPGSLMAGVYNDYYAKKPIMIAEWGANWEDQNYSDSDRAAFINKFFDAVEARPKIKLICYWYWYDFKFDSLTLPLTTQAYRNRISNQRYITLPP